MQRQTRTMQERTLVRKSKKLSWLLRHGAIDANVDMDAAGWVSIDQVLRICALGRGQLDEIVARNNKSRLTVRGTMIRAVQGHSTSGTPVTVEALEASWHQWTGVAPVFHGTNPRALSDILVQGLKPMNRTHVHLAQSEGSKVGKRANVGVLVGVCPTQLAAAGSPLYQADNGVLLTRFVPVSAIVSVQGVSKAGRRAAALWSM